MPSSLQPTCPRSLNGKQVSSQPLLRVFSVLKSGSPKPDPYTRVLCLNL